MSRYFLIFLVLGACSEPVEAPTLDVLAPADDAVVPAGNVPVTIVVDHFILGDEEQALAPRAWTWADFYPIATASAHGDEGTPRGTCVLRLDGVEVAAMAETVATLTGVTAGPHSLEAELIHEDGEPLDPPVAASVMFSAE